MTRFLIISVALLSLSACVDGTNPFMDTDETQTGTPIATTPTSTTTEDTSTTTAATSGTADAVGNDTTDTGTGIDSGTSTLPGTVSPSANDSIFRREARSEENGNGFAEGFAYDAATDTFIVDNLAFDGDSGYTPVLDGNGNRFGIGPFSIFEAEASVVDGLTSGNIDQLEYRALYGISADGNTSIAIVRTGAFVNYGFGGFIYQREGGVTLPSSGQALYTGNDNYGGLRDFEGQGGLEYVNGDIELAIDFNDFNSSEAVKGRVSNRRVFDMAGNDITTNILAAMGPNATQLPELFLEIEEGVLNANGEIAGTISSFFGGEEFESGNYYAVLSGNNAQTIAGIIVVTGDDPRDTTVTVRETGGFFATRQ